MKKIVKLSLIAILLAVVAIAITGCGAEEKDRTYNTLGKTLLGDTYILEIEGDALGGNGKSGTLTVAKKGDKILQEVKSEDGKVAIIFKDNATHIVIPDEKMYMKTDGKDESILSDDEAFLSKEELEALKTEEYKTGKEKIDDKEYYYEEYYALLIIFNLIFGFIFNTKLIIFYLIIIASNIIGSMFGIQKKD